MKKIIKQIEEYVQDKIDEAYAEGYNDGNGDAFTDRDVGFYEGIANERERVISMFKMLSQQELVNGSAAKAKSYAMAADTVDVANHMEHLDWSEEGIAKWNDEENERDGF
jgi:hypothetical protein